MFLKLADSPSIAEGFYWSIALRCSLIPKRLTQSDNCASTCYSFLLQCQLLYELIDCYILSYSIPPLPYGHNSLYTFLYLYFHLRNCSYNILLLFPFKYPIKFHTLILGSISTSICICSGYTFAFIYFVHSHPVLNISTITLLFW